MSLCTIHTISGEVPLPVSNENWYRLVVDCGKPIQPAAIAFLWDSQTMNCSVEWAANVCAKCRKVSDNKNARYVYGVCRGTPEVQP